MPGPMGEGPRAGAAVGPGGQAAAPESARSRDRAVGGEERPRAAGRPESAESLCPPWCMAMRGLRRIARLLAPAVLQARARERTLPRAWGSATMSELSGAEWRVPKGALNAARSGTGRPLRGERRVTEGLVRRRDGAERRSLPERCDPWWRAAQPHVRWSHADVRRWAFECLSDAGRSDLDEVFPDGTSIRVDQEATGASEPRLGSLARRPRNRGDGRVTMRGGRR